VNIKNYSYESVLARLEARTLARLDEDDKNAQILLFGTNRALLEAAAEEISDAVTYDEHLTREAVWDTAQGYSSIMKQVAFYNYRPHSRIGATGKLRVSTSETFDGEYPYNITIPQWAAFSGGGLVFLSTKQMYLPVGTKYIDIDIVQGKLKTRTISVTEALFPQPQGAAYAKLAVEDPNIESNNFEVRVNGSIWTEVDHIRLAKSNNDKVYTREILTAYRGVSLGFGNDMFGKALQYGDVVTITYIETEGKNGNIFASGIVTAVDSEIFDEIGTKIELFCTNLSAISGGKDYEPIDDIRANAPQAYQTSDRAITSKDYEFLIKVKNFVDRISVWGEKEINEDLGNKPGTFLPATQNLIYITGFLIDPNTQLGISMPDSTKDKIREFLNDKKGTTDILQFVDTQFVYLNFKVRAFISDYRYTPEQVRAFIHKHLLGVYQANTAEYRKSLYFSDYYAEIDGIEGIDHHTTSFFLSEMFKFDSAYEFTANIDLEMIRRGSVSIKVRSVAHSMDWTEIARDDGNGNIIGLPVDPEDPAGERYQFPSTFITYASGKIGKVVITNGLEFPFTSYEIRIDFELDEIQEGNILLTKRQQIIAYYSEHISVEYMG
jgi:hypothetical protein